MKRAVLRAMLKDEERRTQNVNDKKYIGRETVEGAERKKMTILTR